MDSLALALMAGDLRLFLFTMPLTQTGRYDFIGPLHPPLALHPVTNYKVSLSPNAFHHRCSAASHGLEKVIRHCPWLLGICDSLELSNNDA